MKKYYFVVWVIIFLITGNYVNSQNIYDYLIFPDTTERIILVVANDSIENANFLTGVKIDNNSIFSQKITDELSNRFNQSVIKLNQCSRNFSGNTEGPNVLYISKNEGGFPRHGITILEDNKIKEYADLNYVDLVVRDNMFEYGALDIYSHELGHVMMFNIWSKFPEYISRKQHVSMGVTDYYRAFNEGWGIHFQRLAYDNVPLYRKGFEKSFDYDRINKLWHSNVDENLRINAVLSNNYVYRKLLPHYLPPDSLTHEDLILLEHTSPIFDFTKLKNAQQMLACEGVLATLFYKINTNKILQDSYRHNEFYNNFLLEPLDNNINPSKVFTPLENVILKNFWVWNQIKSRDFKQNQILIEFIKEWCNCFPEDKNEILKIFISITIGKTINNELGNLYEQMSWYGSIGNYSEYKNISNLYIQKFVELKEMLINDISLIDNNIGPELWVENKEVEVKVTLWNNNYKKPLQININTASLYEIASFKGFNLQKAEAFIKKRDELGYFASFSEAKEYGFEF